MYWSLYLFCFPYSLQQPHGIDNVIFPIFLNDKNPESLKNTTKAPIYKRTYEMFLTTKLLYFRILCHQKLVSQRAYSHHFFLPFGLNLGIYGGLGIFVGCIKIYFY